MEGFRRASRPPVSFLELETAKDILAELFHPQPLEIEYMILRA